MWLRLVACAGLRLSHVHDPVDQSATPATLATPAIPATLATPATLAALATLATLATPCLLYTSDAADE